jgi:hypothetical protein
MRYVSSHRDRCEDDHATSMCNSVLSSKAMGSRTAGAKLAAELLIVVRKEAHVPVKNPLFSRLVVSIALKACM